MKVRSHPFAPGDQVGVHRLTLVDHLRAQNAPPGRAPDYSASVAADGTLNVTAARGTYALAGPERTVQLSGGGTRPRCDYVVVTI